MGKAGKRKARQRRKQQQKEAAAVGNAHHQPNNNNNKAVQKLRHADAKQRHAALIALQNMMMVTTSRNKIVALPVLQAIREQVTSNHLECSATAAECLVLYLQANTVDAKRHEATAAWAFVLLGRLEQCVQNIIMSEENDNKTTANNANNNNKHTQSWWAVTSPCIHALCLLIETNEKALEQLLMQRQKFCAVIFQILHASLPQQAALQHNAALYAARSLHSALDDNYELAESVMESLKAGSTSVLEQCLQQQQDTTMVQLHLIGSLVNLYPMASEGEKQGLEDLLLKYAIRSCPSTTPVAAAVSPMRTDDETTSTGNNILLLQPILTMDFDQWKALRQRYDEAEKLHQTQQEDEQIENEVVKQVHDRKEPAREIARRQKKQSEEEEEAAKKKAMEDDVNMEDAATTTVRGKFDKREQNGEEAMEEALQAWSAVIGPLQLSSEILANLLTNFIPNDSDDMEEDGDDAMMTTTAVKSDNRIFQALQSNNVGIVLANGVSSAHAGMDSMDPAKADDNTIMDHPILNDIVHAVGKLCACLSNFILTNGLPSEDLSKVWASLGVAFGCRPHPTMDSITGTLAILAQQESSWMLPRQFSSPYCIFGKPDADEYTVETRRNCVAIMSAVVLKGTEDSADFSKKVRELTDSIASELSRKDRGQDYVPLHCEMLNAFMDWFGQDDFYPHLFQQLNLLQVCQSSLERLSKYKSSLSLEEEEILENAERFVEYKQSMR